MTENKMVVLWYVGQSMSVLVLSVSVDTSVFNITLKF